jgi:WD40 repeat protein
MATGYPKMSKDGEYILIKDEMYEEYDEFYYKLLDKNGRNVFQIVYPRTETGDQPEVDGDISADGNYVVIGNTFYENTGKKLWSVDKGTGLVISPNSNYIIFYVREIIYGAYEYGGEKYAKVEEEFLFYNKSGELLWKLSDLGARAVGFSSDENYLIVETCEEIKTFDKNGRLLWSKDKEFKQTHTVQGSDFTDNGEFFVIGIIKNVSFEPYFVVEYNANFYDKNGNIIWKLDFGEIDNINMSNDGKYIAIGGGKTLYLYDNSGAIE